MAVAKQPAIFLLVSTLGDIYVCINVVTSALHHGRSLASSLINKKKKNALVRDSDVQILIVNFLGFFIITEKWIMFIGNVPIKLLYWVLSPS
jgi:hypothetical protein